MRHRLLVAFLCAPALLVSAGPASAQFIGTFSWQTLPYCNIVTLNVTQAGTDFILEGVDNLCGADRRAPVTGTATINPNGTVGLGLAILNVQGGDATHVDATVDFVTLGGTWSDSVETSGAFALNGAGVGSPRPTGRIRPTSFSSTFEPRVTGRRARGSPTAPLGVSAGSVLLSVGGIGHDGSAFSSSPEAFINLVASEPWTPSAHGTRIDFFTTPNGQLTTNQVRMRIDQDGQVGIGNTAPAQRLDVFGNVRIGTGVFGCVEDRDGDVIAGICASDARFKRDVAPFEPMLNKVAALRPVHFYWRAGEFPARAFGSQQSYGLVAQEVEEVLPELVATGADGYKAVNYSKLPLIALQAIRELKAKNDALEAQNADFARRLAELEARVKQ